MAKRNISINVAGLLELENNLESMGPRMKRNVTKGMNNYNGLAEEGSRALAPHDEGDLEISIQAVDPTWEGDVIMGGVASSSKYALRRHEEPGRQGKRPKYDNGVRFDEYYEDGLGKETRSRPSWRGEMPGRKYMDRAIGASENELESEMANALDETLGGRG